MYAVAGLSVLDIRRAVCTFGAQEVNKSACKLWRAPQFLGLTPWQGLCYYESMSYPIADQINYTLVSCPPGKYQSHDIAA
jgi:hypothetical protein